MGTDGSLYRKGDFSIFIPARQVRTLDTTGAGDAFIGYFLAGMADGSDPGYSLTRTTAAAAIAVTRPGASGSIPALEEVLRTM